MNKLLEKIRKHFIIYIRVWKRKGTGMTNFAAYAPGRIIVPTRELKKQEKYIFDNKLNEKEANEYRRNKVFICCNEIKAEYIYEHYKEIGYIPYKSKNISKEVK